MIDISKDFLALFTVCWMTLTTGVYLFGVFRQGVKPHLFSWLLWGLINIEAGAAQIAGHGGVGAWTTAYCGANCLVVVAIALVRGEKQIVRSDWVLLGMGLAALPLWAATDSSLVAVFVVTFVDLVAYIPTLRKAYARPHEESATAFSMACFSCFLSFVSLELYTLTTALYPLCLIAANLVLIGLIWVRRRVLTE